jgi:hypothetical protein
MSFSDHEEFLRNENERFFHDLGSRPNPHPDPVIHPVEPVRMIRRRRRRTARTIYMPDTGIRQDVFSLPEGPVVIEWPAALSSQSYQDFCDFLDLVARKMKASVLPKNILPQLFNAAEIPIPIGGFPEGTTDNEKP